MNDTSRPAESPETLGPRTTQSEAAMWSRVPHVPQGHSDSGQASPGSPET